jgi:hypothetical protein
MPIAFGCLPDVNSVRSYNIVRRKNGVEVALSGKWLGTKGLAFISLEAFRLALP